MFYIGIFLWIWLGIGFIVGLKQIYLDGYLEESNIESLEEYVKGDVVGEWVLEFLFGSKIRYLAVASLFGVISFWFDTADTFSKD